MKVFLKKQMVMVFFVALVILSALGIYAFVNIQRLIDAVTMLSEASRIVNNAERLLVLSIDIETGVRGYVITGDSDYLAPYESSQAQIAEHVNMLMASTRHDPIQNRRIMELSRLVDERTELARRVLLAGEEDIKKAQELVATGEGKRIMDEIRALITTVQNEERASFREQNTVTGESLLRFQYAFVGWLIIPVVLIVTLFYSINRHLNARTTVEQNLRQASAEITELNKELEAYTYSVSHDLRAPLRSISGYAQVLKEDYSEKLDSEGNRVIDVVIRNSSRMGQLIDDLLHFSRIGRKELILASCDMEEIVRTTVDELLANERDRKVDIQINDLKPSYADISMIRQVWVNLISNALKYSSTRAESQIQIGCYDEGNSVCYYIKDNGVGFNMAYRDKLFGVFQRLHKISEFEGTGVGLALVKKIIVRHGGRIWAEAQLDEGATFYFSLPHHHKSQLPA